MATTDNTVQSTPQKRRLSHITTHYDYSSPIFKKAIEKPLYAPEQSSPSDFKYYPILCNLHLMCETYHDTCWAMKHKDLSPEEWSVHLSTPHNYACVHRHCSLQFAERAHLEKHIPICKASKLLMASRKERSKEIHKTLINFHKIKPKPADKKKKVTLAERYDKHTEKVWITCYPDSSYVCSKLSGWDRSAYDYDASCTDPQYLDPKNNPPLSMDKCYFAPVPIEEEKKVNEPQNKIKLKKRRIAPPKHHRKTRNRNRKKAAVQSSSGELEDDDTESSTSSSSSDSSTRSDHQIHEMKEDESTDSEHDNHHNTNSNNNNNNNDNKGRTIHKMPASATPNETQNGAQDVVMNDVKEISNTQSTQQHTLSCSIASFPANNGSNSLDTLLQLPNLNDFPVQKVRARSPDSGTKRKAESLGDSIDCMPPHKKQKLNTLHHAKHRIPMQAIQQVATLPIGTGSVTKLSATPISGPNAKPKEVEERIPLPPSSTVSSALIVNNSMNNSPRIESASRPQQSVLSTSNCSKFYLPLNFLRMTSNEDVLPKKKKNKRKLRKNKGKHKRNGNEAVINLIGDDDDEEKRGDAVVAMDTNNETKHSEWSEESFASKLRYIFHPFHIYSVSQQFTDKSYTKAKKLKRKKRDIKCYKMNESTAHFTQKELNQKWKAIQQTKAHQLKNLHKKFNGSEISFEFLNFVQIVPSEQDINAEHILTSVDLQRFIEGLFTQDAELEYLNVYSSSFRSKMRQLLSPQSSNELSFKSKVFLYSFLRCGVGLLPKAFDAEYISSAMHIHNAYYQFLNDHFCAQSVYRNAGVRDIAFKKDGSCFKEFVFRHHPTSEDWSHCTLDLSLKMGGIMCNELQNRLEQCQAIQSLKTLYNELYPNKQLRLVNMGFFQSPPENPGQNWHSDYEFTSIHDKYTQLSPVVTVIISLVKQKYDAMTTTGSTVFCLGSNHSPEQIRKLCKKYPNECETWLYKVIQPVLEKGDIACFAGHTLHFGGAYNYVLDRDQLEDRVALYGVLHLLPKTAKHDEYLETDMNIYDGQKTESLFGGGRYNIIRKENNENHHKKSANPYVVKKYRWRDRNQHQF